MPSPHTKPPKTLTRAQLATLIEREVGLSYSSCAMLVNEIFDHVCEALIGEGSVKITGFGRFIVRHKRARLGRNPRTGVPAKISARRVIVFHPSPMLRKRLNRADTTSAN